MRVRGLQDAFSPNTMDRWTGLIFNNKNMTLLGLPHTHGEKWVRTHTRAHTDTQKQTRCDLAFHEWWAFL